MQSRRPPLLRCSLPTHVPLQSHSIGIRQHSSSFAHWVNYVQLAEQLNDLKDFITNVQSLLEAICYANAKSLQSCPTLCDPIDGSPPGSAVPGILQARILEWVAISFSNAWKRKVKVKSLSRVRHLVTPWTAAYQAPLSMDFPGKSTGVGCHCLLH